jgi:hypothetical protein
MIRYGAPNRRRKNGPDSEECLFNPKTVKNHEKVTLLVNIVTLQHLTYEISG